MQLALSPARCQVQDDAPNTTDDQRLQVLLITDDNSGDRPRGIDQFIDQPAYIIMSMARRLHQPTPPAKHHTLIVDRWYTQGLIVEAGGVLNPRDE